MKILRTKCRNNWVCWLIILILILLLILWAKSCGTAIQDKNIDNSTTIEIDDENGGEDENGAINSTKRRICGIRQILYQSKTVVNVQNKEDAEKVFKEFIPYAKENNVSYYDHGYPTKMHLIEYAGYSMNKEYWEIRSYLSEEGEESSFWGFAVSEDGEVVTIISCI